MSEKVDMMNVVILDGTEEQTKSESKHNFVL